MTKAALRRNNSDGSASKVSRLSGGHVCVCKREREKKRARERDLAKDKGRFAAQYRRWIGKQSQRRFLGEQISSLCRVVQYL